MRAVFSIPKELKCRLWHRETPFSYKLIVGDPSWTVRDAKFGEREVLLCMIIIKVHFNVICFNALACSLEPRFLARFAN
jgi:hypothetical protein